ncbi:MAG: hypothetical protein AAF915_26345 [Cyanobacteria bacterium P01_D01_bin.50]
MFKTFPVHLKIDDNFKEYLTAQCKLSNSLFNSAVYIIRQHYYQQLEQDTNYSTYWRGDDYRVGRKLKKIQGLNYNKLWNQLKNTELVAGLGEVCESAIIEGHRQIDKKL